jgi:hypothetical protein
MKTETLLFFSLLILLVASGCAMVGLPISNNSIESNAAALGDLDGDGDLDSFLANGSDEAAFTDTIWINQGGAQAGQAGKFAVSRQQLGGQDSYSLGVGDLDRDGDLDAVAGNAGGFIVYLNLGNRQGGRPGQFIVQNRYDESEGAKGIFNVVLGDLNGDGALDVYEANCCGAISSVHDTNSLITYSHIWLNDGNGDFSESGQRLGIQGSQAAALGDLDGDGDLDVFSADDSAVIDAQGTLERNLPAFVATRGPALVWLNDGAAQFSDSGQRLGDQRARAAWLGDLDSDGDLDAFIIAAEGASIWLNDGEGRFSLSRQELNIPQNYASALGDLDGDGDLDLFAGFVDRDFQVWWNDGFGRLGTSWR